MRVRADFAAIFPLRAGFARRTPNVQQGKPSKIILGNRGVSEDTLIRYARQPPATCSG